MKAAEFDYRRPDTLEEALRELASAEDAKVLAGGQSLIPMLNMRLSRPASLIDIGAIDGLAEIISTEDGLRIGAMARQRDVECSHLVAERCPLLVDALGLVAHPQIRNQGTVCGSLAHADPAAELPAAMLALDAVLQVAGPHGTRSIPAHEFFVSYLTTALGPGEILTAVEVPATVSSLAGWACHEISLRPGDFPLCGAAAALARSTAGTLSDVRLALYGVADRPLRATASEDLLNGNQPTGELLEAAAELAARDLSPMSDIHASSAYRRRLARVIARRTLEQAIRRGAARAI